MVLHMETDGSCSKLPAEADIFSARVGLCLEVKPSGSLNGQVGALTSDV